MKDTVRYEDYENLLSFMEDFTEAQFGIVIYTGNSVEKITNKIYYDPWDLVC